MVLSDHLLALLGSEAKEREHSNLGGDMVPVALGSVLNQGSLEEVTHLVHSVSDGLEFREPLLSVFRDSEDLSSDSSTVNRGRRVVRSNNDLDLTVDLISGGLITADNVHSSSSLTVESHGLSEALSNDHLEALLQEVSHAVSVLFEITGGESLVGYVEVGEQIVFLHGLGDSVPLLRGGINTSGVVSASVQEDDGAWLGVGEIGEHAVKVQSLGLGVVVSIFSNFESSSLEYLSMVGPGRLAEIEGGVSELLEEVSNDLKSSSATQGLAGRDSAALKFGVIPTEGNLLGANNEFSNTVNRSVLLIKSGVIDDLMFDLLDNGEDVGFAIVVSVGADTQVDFLGVLVVLEVGGEGKDGVSRSLLHMNEVVNSELGGLRSEVSLELV